MPGPRSFLLAVCLGGVAVPLVLLQGTGGADRTGSTERLVTGPTTSPVAAGRATPAPRTSPAARTSSAPLTSPAPRTSRAVEPAGRATRAAVGPTAAGSGTFVTAPGGTAGSGSGRERRYRVEVEEGLGEDVRAFAAEVDRTLADPRSWGAGGRLSFRRVSAGPVDVRVVLASPDTTDELCRPLDTGGIFSCGSGTTAVINRMRWLRGADAYEGRLADYRRYVVNHEVGHTIGHGHESCSGAGRPAPVMMQQTKGVGACVAQAWPFP